MFSDYYIMRSDDQWRTPEQIYLDTPFKDTGLEAYYGGLAENSSEMSLSENYYQKLGISMEKVGKFSSSVGAKVVLEIEKCSCRQNPNAWELVWNAPGNRTSYEHDEDYTIRNIESVIGINSIPFSKLLWETLIKSNTDHYPDYNTNWTKATYNTNNSQPPRYAPSQLAACLSKAEWIPQQGGGFVTPADASIGLLPYGFKYDSGYKWLAAIRFGENEAKAELRRAQESEEHRQKLVDAEKLGFLDEESLKDGQRFGQLPPDVRKRLFDSLDETSLPSNESADYERRSERVGEEAEEAPGRESEKRPRADSKWRRSVIKEARPFLVSQYTNSDQELICQICEKPMPFQLRDGSYYFVAVECIPDAKRFYRPNYLALCPNHEAMFKNANEDREHIKARIFAMDDIDTRIYLTLAGKSRSVYFTKTHLVDLRASIEVEDNIDEEMIQPDDDEEE